MQSRAVTSREAISDRVIVPLSLFLSHLVSYLFGCKLQAV